MTNVLSNKIKIDCCGCGACYNKCPVCAITMQENEEGFLFPAIDEEKCTNCGLCTKVCPYINAKYNNSKNPKCYAIMANDEIRAKSSSGGMFTLMAEYILGNSGYVCGAAYRDDFSVHHIIIDKKEDLDKLRGSKYFQSETEDCYKKVLTLLKEDKTVLYTGCPCQIAGLRTFLGKNYDNLLTMELLCHGTPPYKVFRKYLDENHNINDIEKISFRDKSINWHWSCDTLTIFSKNGEINKYHVSEDSFEKGFHKSLFNRKSCTPCKYAQLPRQADITIADWWGISKFAPEMNDSKGTSLVLINNQKGQTYFDYVKNNAYKLKEIPLEDAKKSVNVTIYRPLKMHPKREIFYRDLNKYTLNSNVKKCLQGKYDICCISIFYGSNYGTVLVSYAVEKILENLGYTVLMLDQPNFLWGGNGNKKTISRIFGRKYYNLSKQYNSTIDMMELNNICDTFITGSDQMFNPRLNLQRISFLEFVKNNKNKIAFASSFGHDNYDVEETRFKKDKYLLQRFNHVSLREVSDNLCKKIFDIDATEVIDPTLILDRKYYEELIIDTNINLKYKLPEKYLLTYILDINDEKVKAIKYVAEKLNLKIINIQNLDFRQRKNVDLEYLQNYTPEEFLYLYKNASFVVTDSYHGTCFSIKFNKQFISIMNKGRGQIRYKIFEKLKIMNRIIESANLVYDSNIISEVIDYSETNSIIKENAAFAINWLDLAIKDNNKQYTIADEYIDSIKENYYKMSKKINNQQVLCSITEEVRGRKKHKVLTIFGIKFKFKVKSK